MLCYCVSLLEHFVFTIFIVAVGHVWHKEGLDGILRILINLLKTLPGFEYIIQQVLSSEVKSFTKQMKGSEGEGRPVKVKLPEKGIPRDQLLTEMEKLKGEQKPKKGKLFAYIFTKDDETFRLQQKAYDLFTEKTGMNPEHDQLIRLFYEAFMHENALNPLMFPNLRRFENEIISMTSEMMHGDHDVVGSLTSGGTESILMAMKVYRDRARKLWPRIKHPQMVAPITIHPAHEKAAHYFGFEIIHVPVGNDFIPDVDDYERAITPNTIALLASAPQYCHGIVDPIEEISDIAIKKGLPLHVDSCFGGFMLPWVEKLGYPVPKYDFRLPGVTSISADVHKYGYSSKGASVILYRNSELRKYQIFAYSRWPGGLFGSPSMAGSRPGGLIASAWVALMSLGVSGYMEMAKKLMDTTNKLKDGINRIESLHILGKPHMTSFAIGSHDPDVDIMVVGDVMERGGWRVERQLSPESLHCTILPSHIAVVEELLQALKTAVMEVKSQKGQVRSGSSAMYGMVAKIPEKTIIDDFIVEFFNEVYKM
ncbi:hypothetical protein LSH36_419g01016 [Paralvinella palmiformis]|uniref:sphinganine-1-phosphate aldolase n=1 Tax=Paralvinella palmiformis TaxID=53620 RepID=A0AAD9JCH5_9ANNE|nr:hypothetical protein LSH36_419g01016 [Paralvinella palmiformis]